MCYLRHFDDNHDVYKKKVVIVAIFLSKINFQHRVCDFVLLFFIIVLF